MKCNTTGRSTRILHGQVRFHHYCFTGVISIITGQKLPVAIFKKDVSLLSKRLQCILLRINQYRIKMLYKSGPDLFIADWFNYGIMQKTKVKKYLV